MVHAAYPRSLHNTPYAYVQVINNTIYIYTFAIILTQILLDTAAKSNVESVLFIIRNYYGMKYFSDYIPFSVLEQILRFSDRCQWHRISLIHKLPDDLLRFHFPMIFSLFFRSCLSEIKRPHTDRRYRKISVFAIRTILSSLKNYNMISKTIK